MWESEQVPKDLKDTVITIFKKGDCKACGNYRSISLLLIAGKIFDWILLNRLQVVAEEILPESQYGFQQACSTINRIFCARQIQEKSRKQQKPLFFVFLRSGERLWQSAKDSHVDGPPKTRMSRALRRSGLRSARRYVWTCVPWQQADWRVPHHIGSEVGLLPRPYTLLPVPSRYAPWYSAWQSWASTSGIALTESSSTLQDSDHVGTPTPDPS